MDTYKSLSFRSIDPTDGKTRAGEHEFLINSFSGKSRRRKKNTEENSMRPCLTAPIMRHRPDATMWTDLLGASIHRR